MRLSHRPLRMTDTLRRSFRIAASHPSLPGHFPGQPVVPGVVLLDQIAAMLESEWKLRLVGLPQVKFIRPLLPECDAEAVIEGSGGNLRFRISVGNETIASGVIEAQP
jgi:3-hydroxyacyl-[acyl-carrier-protein] dehydratase